MNEIKNEILYKLNTLIGILNNVEVKGEQNCDNISGGIKMVRDICSLISKCSVEKPDEKKSAAKQAKEE